MSVEEILPCSGLSVSLIRMHEYKRFGLAEEVDAGGGSAWCAGYTLTMATRDSSGESGPDGAAAKASLLAGTPNLVLAAAVALIVAMFVIVLERVPINFMGDDSFFYYQVAWNFAHGRGSTFNGIIPTNGYHPLWMLMCALVYVVVESKDKALHVIAMVIALLDVVTFLTVAALLRRVGRNMWPVAFAMLVPFCFLTYIGTEGALSGVCLALMMFAAWNVCVRRTPGAAVLYTLLYALAVLCRLDNIFIVSLMLAGVWIALGPALPGRKYLLGALPIPALFWGAYLGSNWVYFHTLEPISGLLKSHGRAHTLGSNLPHTAVVPLLVITLCLPLLAMRQRDVFFRAVELPMALGVYVHAGYIVFFMSSETRWPWYYTSWILLASIMLARVAALLLAARPRLAMPLAGVCVALLLGLWVKVDYKHYYKMPPLFDIGDFNAVAARAGIKSMIVYDKPGALAYYSTVKIVPLDGLMGDLHFQHELATKGIGEFVVSHDIDAFAGPPLPMGAGAKSDWCDQIFLYTVQFHCSATGTGPDGQPAYRTDSVDVYARLPAKFAGNIPLLPADAVPSEYATIWRLDDFKREQRAATR
jgi:hypothetical protein